MSTAVSIHPETLEYDLPSHLIAQEPLKARDNAKLLVIERRTRKISHTYFSDLVQYLKAGDVLVINKAQVSPMKLIGKKRTGGRVEVIFIAPHEKKNQWRALIRPHLKVGTELILGKQMVRLVGQQPNGENILEIKNGSVEKLVEGEGVLPLPPYIKREKEDVRSKADEADYQTVYASVPGSLAAPTAGLHFTAQLLNKLRNNGVKVLEIVLHVGWGTFKPIAHSLASHEMMPEKFEVPAEVKKELVQAWNEKRRVVAVGTTSTRVLESINDQTTEECKGETNLFIKPGHSFKHVNALITNFHVPRSTPISLTAAFVGLQTLERAYGEAIENNYRFYSYGDAMLIL